MIPILGFGSEIQGKYEELINELLREENIDLRDFIIKPLPELASFGTEREFIVKVNDFSATELEDDDLNINKKKVKIKFFLSKGSYATIVIKKMFSE